MTCTDIRLEQKEGVCWLCASVPRADAVRLMSGIDAKKRHTVEVKEERRHRSLDANAYYWTLCGKLAEYHNISPGEVYRQQIREIGGVYDVVCVQSVAAERLTRSWAKKGLGWMSETTESKLPGCVNVTLWYGSSTYDTKQMSQLIDRAVTDCKEAGIETLTPDKLALIKEGWQ